MAIYAGFVILINSAVTIRLPIVLESVGLATPSQSSLLLSLMMLMGILAGMVFSSVVTYLREKLPILILLLLSLGLLLVWRMDNLIAVTIGALLIGLVYSFGVTFVFHRLSELLTSDELAAGTSLVLLGCNIGGGTAATVVNVLSFGSSQLVTGFLSLALLSLLFGIFLIILKLLKHLC